MEDYKLKNYKTITQLCSFLSSSTSAVVCFDGLVGPDKNNDRRTFIEIKSCHDIVRMFKYDHDTWEEFITKLRKLGESCMSFADYCEQEKNQIKFE